MVGIEPVHVVDSNTNRRAQVAFALNKRGIRAHVYEDVAELERFTPRGGLVLLSGDDDPASLRYLRERFLAHGQNIPIAMFSAAPNAKNIVEAMRSGAVDYIEWPLSEDPSDVLGDISVRAQENVQREQRRIAARDLVGTLSKREKEVLALIVAGRSNKDIGVILKISPRTVEIHRANMIQKLKADSTASAVRIGIYAGLDEV